jgi:hypothetical protein
MKLNRKLQKDILVALSEVYPDSLLVSALPGFSHNREFMGNLFYLQEHGIIDGGDIREPGHCRSMVDAQITKAGLDFLANDGGLRAILGYQSVTLDASALLDTLLALLYESGLEDEKRSAGEIRLNNMNGDALADLVVELLQGGDSVSAVLTSYLFPKQDQLKS